jgi:hypothetical protein
LRVNPVGRLWFICPLPFSVFAHRQTICHAVKVAATAPLMVMIRYERKPS